MLFNRALEFFLLSLNIPIIANAKEVIPNNSTINAGVWVGVVVVAALVITYMRVMREKKKYQ